MRLATIVFALTATVTTAVLGQQPQAKPQAGPLTVPRPGPSPATPVPLPSTAVPMGDLLKQGYIVTGVRLIRDLSLIQKGSSSYLCGDMNLIGHKAGGGRTGWFIYDAANLRTGWSCLPVSE